MSTAASWRRCSGDDDGKPLRTTLWLPIVTSLLFAGSFVAGRFTTVDLSPLAATLLRYVFACLALIAWGLLKGWPDLRVQPRWLPALALAGLSGIVAYHMLFFTALRHTAIANAAIINAASPVVTAVAAALLIKERLQLSAHAGIVIAFLGVLVLLSRGDPARLPRLELNYGDVLMLLAVISWVIYSLLVKHLSDKYSGFAITLYTTAFGLLFLCIASARPSIFAEIEAMSLRSWCSVMYMGVAASGAGYLLYNLSIAKIGVTYTSSLVYSLVPVFVTLFGWTLFGEPMTWIMVSSAVLILCGLWLEASG